MRKMKEASLEWIKEIPANWNVNKIKYLFDSGKGLPITKSDLLDEGLPVISYGQIHSKRNNGTEIIDELIRYVDDSYEYLYPQCRVYRHDFVFADTSEDYDGCGNCVYKRDEMTLFAGYHSIILHSKIQNDNRYFAYLFKTDEWRKQLREVASGVKVFSISQKTLINTTVVIPPLEEQEVIADYLDKKCNEIDTLIADIYTQIDFLEQYKKSIITEVSTKGLNPNVKMKDSGNEWIGVIPQSWCFGRVKNVISLLTDYDANGSFKDIANNVYINSGNPYAWMVRITDLTNKNYGLSDDVNYCDEYTYNYLKKSKVYSGDLVMAKRGSIGNIYIIPPISCPATLAPNMYLIRTKENCLSKYLYYLLFSKCGNEQLILKNKSTTLGALYKDDVKNIYIPIPSIDEQKSIVDYLDKKCIEIDSVIEDKRKQITTLEQHKKSLIYEYVTGKKEV